MELARARARLGTRRAQGALGWAMYKRPRRTLFVLKNSAQMRGEREEKGPGVNVEQCLVRKGFV